jgi:hypothetical protein
MTTLYGCNYNTMTTLIMALLIMSLLITTLLTMRILTKLNTSDIILNNITYN